MLRWLVVAMLLLPATARALTFVSVGTGDPGGSYFLVARAICDHVNREDPGGLRCSAESTRGSLYNLTALANGELDLAIAQSDWVRHAIDGTSVFARVGPNTHLRTVMSLHAEPFTLIARRGANIGGMADLVGKRVDVGHPSSGRHVSMDQAMAAFGLRDEDFAAVAELQAGAVLPELCAGRVDAALLILGHPNAGVARALRDCDLVLVPLAGPQVAVAFPQTAGYLPLVIPETAYPGLSGPVATIGVVASLVTRAGLEDSVVEAFVRATLTALPFIRRKAPVLYRVERELMRSRGVVAPLHPAAARAYDAWFAAQGSGG